MEHLDVRKRPMEENDGLLSEHEMQIDAAEADVRTARDQMQDENSFSRTITERANQNDQA